MYTVTYSKFVRSHLVIDSETKLAQSSWTTRLDALITARDLNLKERAILRAETVARLKELNNIAIKRGA